MREQDIPAFVQEVAAAGCDICAVGPGHYVMGDVDVPRGQRRGLYTKLKEIDARYGNRDHLRNKIASHLRSIGRYIDASSLGAVAWAQFPTSQREIDDEPPDLAAVTAYDQAHISTYAALLVAEAKGVDWNHVARLILNIDPQRESERARRAWASHLARAQWLATSGFGENLLQ
ncbi:hypothetical protein [Mesorhizobium sp. 128a]